MTPEQMRELRELMDQQEDGRYGEWSPERKRRIKKVPVPKALKKRCSWCGNYVYTGKEIHPSCLLIKVKLENK